jgi:S-adenosyl-L-methionine hydrolase (adenosine-forming)
MPSPRIVTFLSDFGSRDTFVGQMKGAALAVCPDLTLVDLTHEVPPHDVSAGSYLLWTAYRAFPPGTIHVAVVDPGVGTERRGLVVRTEHYTFVAPDNGLLTRVLDDEPAGSAFVLEATHYRRDSASLTFDGRDAFAPAAAWIARGTEPQHFGPSAEDLARLDLRRGEVHPGVPARVRVLVVDRFGNATLDFPRRALDEIRLPGASAPRLAVKTPRGTVTEMVRTYGEGTEGRPFLLFNSADHLEIAVNRGRAADALGVAAGTEVTVTVD